MLDKKIIDRLEEWNTHFLTKYSKDSGSCIEVTPKIERDLQGLPEELIYIWKKHGICSYENGLWRHTNPREFDGVVEEWLKDTPYWTPDTNRYHVIGRTAYGKLYLWGEKTGQNIEIDPLMGIIYHSESDEKYISKGEACIPVATFIAGASSKDRYDKTDDNDKPLFKRIHKKLGTLQSHEMYTAVPMPAFSGGISLKNAQKEDLFIQLSLILQTIEEPEIIDFEVWDKQLDL
jgi:hypothetical protein